MLASLPLLAPSSIYECEYGPNPAPAPLPPYTTVSLPTRISSSSEPQSHFSPRLAPCLSRQPLSPRLPPSPLTLSSRPPPSHSSRLRTTPFKPGVKRRPDDIPCASSLECKRPRRWPAPLSKESPLLLSPSHPQTTLSNVDPGVDNMDVQLEHEPEIASTSSSDVERPPASSSSHSRASTSASSSSSSAATSDMPRSASSSPPTLPPVRHLQRTNTKRLGLSLSLCLPPSPSGSQTNSAPSADNTPFTPGPPKTPALAMTMGRATANGFRRPSLLTVITQDAHSHPAPSPSGAPAATRRARSSTDWAPPSSFPRYDGSLTTFSRAGQADHSARFGLSIPLSSPPLSYSSTSTVTSASTSASASGSSSSTPSSSPPMPGLAKFDADAYAYPYAVVGDTNPERVLSPYTKGPVEIVPGVFLGAEDSVFHVKAWTSGKRRVRVLNVAQEIEDPFAARRSGSSYDGKGKQRANVEVDTYSPLSASESVSGSGSVSVPLSAPGDSAREDGGDRWPEMDYCHLAWSHGEAGLAGIPAQATLREFMDPVDPGVEGRAEEGWGLWKAILCIEFARKRDVPVLIHCQCGVSRSATLVIAYLMALAASGLEPGLVGHLSGMQDAYDFVKRKSPCIGPNVSLVFQLVEFARNVTTLLSRHPGSEEIQTAWPKRPEHELSEAEWARRRAAFDTELGMAGNGNEDDAGEGMLASPMTADEAKEEARGLDEKMRRRKGLL